MFVCFFLLFLFCLFFIIFLWTFKNISNHWKLADGKKLPSGPKSKLQKVIPFSRHNKLGPNSSVGYFGIQRSEEILPENLQSFTGAFSGGVGPTSSSALLSGQFPETSQPTTSSGRGKNFPAKSKRTRAGTDSEDENLPPRGGQRSGGGHQRAHQHPDSLSSPLSDLSGTVLSSSNQMESSGSGSKTVTDSDSEM